MTKNDVFYFLNIKNLDFYKYNLMSARVSYRRHVSYNTKSNKIRKVKTPGGRLTVLHLKKKVKSQNGGYEEGCG